MIYSLPTGTIVYLTLEEYLNLTDEDVQYLISVTTGDAPNNPFHGSQLNRKGRRENDSLYQKDSHDKSIDFIQDNDEVQNDAPININNLIDPDSD